MNSSPSGRHRSRGVRLQRLSLAANPAVLEKKNVTSDICKKLAERDTGLIKTKPSTQTAADEVYHVLLMPVLN